MSLQKECDSLKDEVLGLKAKIIQMDKEKQELIASQALTLVPWSSQSDSNDQIIKLMAQVSDKDKEIDKLVKINVTLEGEKEDSEIKVDKLKEKLKGYSVLKSTQNAIWDIIIDGVAKLWPELQDYEKRKAHVSSALYKERSANNLLLQLDTKAEEITLKAIKFLKHCNHEALAVPQITDRFRFMSKAQKIVEKSKA